MHKQILLKIIYKPIDMISRCLKKQCNIYMHDFVNDMNKLNLRHGFYMTR